MTDIKNATLVLLLDPNDSNDEIYAFESAGDANILKHENINYYAGGYYGCVAERLARIITLEDLVGREELIPTYIFPAGCLDDLAQELEEAEEDDGDCMEIFDNWLEDNRGNAVSVMDFEGEVEYEEEDED